MKNDNILTFGEFRIDVPARSLLRSSVPIPLNRRAFDVLLYFAQNPGRVVSKEELLKTVWPDSFVDENSLAQSISVLRKAFREQSEENGFIVTLAGRGYQFVAPVESIGKSLAVPAGSELAAEPWRPPNPGDTDVFVRERTIRTSVVTEEMKYPALPAPRSSRPFVVIALLVVAAAIVACAVLWRRTLPTKGTVGGPVSAVLADFENTTGEPKFDHALNQALQIDLEQSPYLEILSRTKIQETLAEMQREKAAPLTPALAREVCERNNALVVLHGLISKFGGQIPCPSKCGQLRLREDTRWVQGQRELRGGGAQCTRQGRQPGASTTGRVCRFAGPVSAPHCPGLDAFARCLADLLRSARKLQARGYEGRPNLAVSRGRIRSELRLGISDIGLELLQPFRL